MSKLTVTQQSTIDRMKPGLWYSAYDLGASLSTMDALVRRGLVERRGVGGLGSSYSPRTGIEFRLVGPGG